MKQKAFALILLLAFALLYASVLDRSLWIDELFSAQVAGEPSIAAVVEHSIQSERRPPLYYLALHVWSGLVGSGEMAQRTFSIACLILSLPLVYLLGKRLGGSSVARWGSVFTAASPFLILYGPMVRAYSMTLLLGCLSALVFFKWLERPSARTTAGYVAVALALIYTDYVGLAVVLAQALVLLAHRGRLRWLDRYSLSTAGILALSYVPWIGVVLAQATRPVSGADFAQSLPGYALKLAYPLYSFSLGETIFPWHPAALVGGLGVGVTFVAALRYWRERPQSGLALGLFVAVPLAFTIFLLSSFAKDITFLNVASRSALVAPYFYIFLAGGIARCSNPLRLAAAAALGIAWAVSLANLYGGQQYHNPIYAVPTRQIAQQVVEEYQPGDAAVFDPDSVFGYYLERTDPGFPSLSTFEADTLPRLQAAPPARIWLVTFGRDRTRDVEPTTLLSWLDQSYNLATSTGYVPQDPLYSRFKELLLHRRDYEHKLLVRRYDEPRER